MMIGVISKNKEREIIDEFFQLFKTPWEFYDQQKNYEVVISTKEDLPDVMANFIIIYSARKSSFDDNKNIKAHPSHKDVLTRDDQIKIPIYGDLILFRCNHHDHPILYSNEREIAGYTTRKNNQRVARIGYDLFQEINILLNEGQPRENSLYPTLDLHISLLRDLIIQEEILLVEIPSVPSGYNFIACLTHDVDFIGIKYHFFDKTMLGFIYRATFGSFINILTNKISIFKFIENLKAVLFLPLIYIGISKDIWHQFDEYIEIEDNVRSTYFFIPFKNRRGTTHTPPGKNSGLRAVKYDLDDVGETIKTLHKKGFEIGVHGIDAWHDDDAAKQEMNRIQHITKSSNMGIRMHWLYFNRESFQILEKAGYAYDSSGGYNDAVGYRNGTGQVFYPIGDKSVVELPLHIQDVALFSNKKMNLTNRKAFDLCKRLLQNAIQYSGILTILWHQRSIGPERLYGDFYRCIIKEMKRNHAWFGTAMQIVEWFSKRRNIVFKKSQYDGNKLYIKLGNYQEIYPSPLLRVHLGKKGYIDIPINNKEEVVVPI